MYVPKKFYPKNARRQAAGSHHWHQGSGVARDHRHQRMPWGDRTRHLASKRGPVNPLKSRLTAYPLFRVWRFAPACILCPDRQLAQRRSAKI